MHIFIDILISTDFADQEEGAHFLQMYSPV